MGRDGTDMEIDKIDIGRDDIDSGKEETDLKGNEAYVELDGPDMERD